MPSASRKVSAEASDAKLLLLNIVITEISCVDMMTHPRPLTWLLIDDFVFADNWEMVLYEKTAYLMGRGSFYFRVSRRAFWWVRHAISKLHSVPHDNHVFHNSVKLINNSLSFVNIMFIMYFTYSTESKARKLGDASSGVAKWLTSEWFSEW